MGNVEIWWYVLGAAVVLAVAAVAVVLVRRSRKGETADDLYTLGLNYLLAGDLDRALDALKRSVSKNTSNIDAYIRIGDILRQKGQLERAIKVHRELTVRTGLRKDQLMAIYRSLVEDYRAAGEYKKAAAVLEKMLQLQKNDPWALRTLIEVHETLEDWDKAAEWRRRWQKVQGVDQSHILALYKVEQGRKAIEQGKEKEGRIRFREAMKLDPGCAAAYLELCDSYIREGREKDALKALREFVHKAPRQAYLAFDRIHDVLFRIGQYGEVETILSELIQQNPEAVRARLSLAEVYEKKGELDEAIRLCEEA
ncbi:MAG: tetratricopeptide repeat protein, partial [Calditrichaeota bacterium]|nr:tetratricopeptide repeat protein [Calditrichota bacterium]